MCMCTFPTTLVIISVCFPKSINICIRTCLSFYRKTFGH
jgi:hypothetical protein